jgi:hypothetical protein
MIAVTHHDVIIGMRLQKQDTNHLIVVIDLILGRVLIVLRSLYMKWFDNRC